jgi:hypothetical protein
MILCCRKRRLGENAAFSEKCGDTFLFASAMGDGAKFTGLASFSRNLRASFANGHSQHSPSGFGSVQARVKEWRRSLTARAWASDSGLAPLR